MIAMIREKAIRAPRMNLTTDFFTMRSFNHFTFSLRICYMQLFQFRVFYFKRFFATQF